MNWIDGITRQDLHENYQEMFDIVSEVCPADHALAVVLKLSEHYAKQGFYFRSLKEIITERKKRYIIQHFNGSNHADLARVCDFSLQYVYEILAEDRGKRQGRLFENEA